MHVVLDLGQQSGSLQQNNVAFVALAERHALYATVSGELAAGVRLSKPLHVNTGMHSVPPCRTCQQVSGGQNRRVTAIGR